ncbi:unnamed protein product [Schistocephalus solidus]|uniref:Uncharacterized protein n=1 Tax=Schistocephalus solidus TaxID=70667 RepID=A0A183TH03_SCHSO|nr:unnamed protein product [Schistocephalus solidus]
MPNRVNAAIIEAIIVPTSETSLLRTPRLLSYLVREKRAESAYLTRIQYGNATRLNFHHLRDLNDWSSEKNHGARANGDLKRTRTKKKKKKKKKNKEKKREKKKKKKKVELLKRQQRAQPLNYVLLSRQLGQMPLQAHPALIGDDIERKTDDVSGH